MRELFRYLVNCTCAMRLQKWACLSSPTWPGMSSTSTSQLFCPFRAVGFSCNHVPLVTTCRGPDSFVVTAVGKSFHQYRCDKLQLLFVGTPQPHALACIAASHPRLIWAAYKNTVKGFSRGREVTRFHGHKGSIHILLPFGEHLVTIDDQNCLKIWALKKKELYGELHFDPKSFPIICAMHPSTYMNKILVASRSGKMQLWNVRTNKLIFSFAGWASAVLTVVQSPAVDVVGAGLEDGNVVLHNLRYDETLMKFRQEWGPVVILSFRTDGINTVASASPSGDIAVWDLDKRRLGTVIREAHGAVTGMQFLPSQPLLLTSGPDNCLKMWIFDQSDGSARLLRSRCGHSAPPTRVQFWSRGGLGLLSAGLDNSLRRLSITRDVQSNTEFSQGSIVKKARAQGVKVETLKLRPVIAFAHEVTRAREWDSVVTCHAGHRSAHTWNLYNHTIGKHKLRSKHKTARPLCVTVTGCGNFCVLGMSSGHVEMFNMQSGIHRGEFGAPRAHPCPVRGVAVNGVNTEVYTGAADGTISFWSFRQKTLLGSLKLSSPIASLVYHRESCMLAVACDNFTLRVVDTDTRRIVRTFTGHTNRITDMVFSPDSRWLVTASMDCSIRTWDMATGRLLDYFLVDAPPTSLSLSATSDFLATTHVDDLGIYLWSNKTLYSPVTLRPLPSDFRPLTLDLPMTRGDREEEEGEEEGEGEGEEEQDEMCEVEMVEGESQGLVGVTPLGEGLVTLSTLPKSHWSNLQNMDIIKKRNKPIEPPKQPKAAPFFLPTLSGLTPKFVSRDNEGDIPDAEAAGSKIVNLEKLEPLSKFQRLLEDCYVTKEYSQVIDELRGMSPSAVDKEFRCLSSEEVGSEKQLLVLLTALLHQLHTRRDYELTQAYLGLALKFHSKTISKSAELTCVAEQLLEVQKSSWQHLHGDLDMAGCLLAYFKSATV